MSMSMSMKYLYSANSRRSNLRRWRVSDYVIGRSKKIRFGTGLESRKTVWWADMQRKRVPIIRRRYTKSTIDKNTTQEGAARRCELVDKTRNTLDCDQCNYYSSRIVVSYISIWIWKKIAHSIGRPPKTLPYNPAWSEAVVPTTTRETVAVSELAHYYARLEMNDSAPSGELFTTATPCIAN